MDKRNRIIKIFAAPFITVLIMLILYAVKGITPFGSGNILGGDLYQQGVFDFFYVYDSIRSGSFFYDFLTAGGFARGILTCIFVPHYWPLAFIPRSSILVYISLLVIIKLAVIALSASYSFSKLFEKLSPEWTTAVALLYTFSGYNVQYFTNLGWLDVVALYPLLILSIKRMFEGKSKLPYVLILTYLLTINTYMAFFVVVSLIIFGGLYIFTADNLEKRKEHIYALGAGTAISLAASSYHIYSFFYGVTSTTRFVEYSSKAPDSTPLEKILKLFASGIHINIISVFMFLGTSLAIACLVVLTILYSRNKEKKKYVLFFGISLLFLVLQVIFYGTELLWHGGSRIMFPYRNGFLVAFMASAVVAYFVTNAAPDFENYLNKTKIHGVLPVLTVAVSLAVAVIITIKNKYIFTLYSPAPLTNEQENYIRFAVSFVALFAIAYLGILLIQNKKAKEALLFSLTGILIMTNAFGFIGNPKGSEKAISYASYYSDCEEVKSLFDTDSNKLARISNPDLSLVTNYPYYTQTPAISNWTHSVSDEHKNILRALGFSTVYTRLLDNGGTEFSRALLGVRQSVSKEKLEDRLYEKLDKSESGFIKYKNRFSFPTGVFYSANLSDISYENYDNIFEYQNALFERLSGKKELFGKNLIENAAATKQSFEDYTGEKSEKYSTVTLYKAKIKTKKDSTLYMKLTNPKMKIVKITVNGILFNVFEKAESKAYGINTEFPSEFNNNVLELGVFDGETIDISFDVLEGELSSVLVYSMDNSKLESYCKSLKPTDCTTGNDYIRINAQYDSDGYIFIPLSYSKDWSCSVNGKAVETEKVIGDFTQIPVESGNNSIELKYPRKPAYMSVLKNLIAFAAAIILVLIEKLFKVKPKWLYNVLLYAFMLLFAATVSIIYVLPILFTIIVFIKKRAT